MERRMVVKAIKKIILDIKEKCIIKNTAIRDSIFDILENECTVIYYPLENEKNRGFHIKKIVKNELKDFVYINTAKPIAEQIFAAAHEFGHIWEVAGKVWKILGYEGKLTEKEEEDITDFRFKNVYDDIEQRKYFCFYDYEYYLDVSKQHELMADEKSLLEGLREAFVWYKDNSDKVNKKPYFEFIDDTLLSC